MPIDSQVVNATDTLEQWRQKDNSNNDLHDASINALDSQATAHVAAGHADTVHPTTAGFNASQATQDAALTTHKASADHDARYIATSYFASLIRNVTDQTIDGIKTFLKKLIVKVADPALELLHSDATNLARVRGGIGIGGPFASFDVGSGANWKQLLSGVYGDTFVDFPVVDVKAKGKKLATEEYVQGFQGAGGGSGLGIAYHGSIDIASIAKTVTYPCLLNGIDDYFFIPIDCHLTRIRWGQRTVGVGNVIFQDNQSVNIALTPPIASTHGLAIRVKINTSDGGGVNVGVKISIYEWRDIGAGGVETLLCEYSTGALSQVGLHEQFFFTLLLT